MGGRRGDGGPCVRVGFNPTPKILETLMCINASAIQAAGAYGVYGKSKQLKQTIVRNEEGAQHTI